MKLAWIICIRIKLYVAPLYFITLYYTFRQKVLLQWVSVHLKAVIKNVTTHNMIKKKVTALKILPQNLKQKWNVFYKNWKE